MQGGAPNPANPNVPQYSPMQQQSSLRMAQQSGMPEQRGMTQQRRAPSINREEMLQSSLNSMSNVPDWLRNRVQAPQPMRRGGQVHRGLGAIVPRRR